MPYDLKASALAGIVTYNPDAERLRQNIEAVLHNGIKRITVVDNGSKNADEISALADQYPDVFLIRNAENVGIAYALNQIFHEAYDSGCYPWVLTLDQDTVIDDNLIEVYGKYCSEQKVASITALHRDRNYQVKQKHADQDAERVIFCMTSANLVRTEVWKEVGGFDNRLFIDEVDTDFCYRLQEHGYIILRINQPLFLHEIGNATAVNFLGKKRIVTNHSAFRKYYMVRNRLYMLRKGRQRGDSYSNLFRFMLKTALFEKEDRNNKIRSMTKGFIDGLKMQ